MTKTFKNLLENLINTIDETNEEMIKNVMNTNYDFACVKQNVKFDTYFKILSNKWNKIIDELISNKDNCKTISELYYIEKISKQVSNIPIDPSVINQKNISQQINNISTDPFASSQSILNNVKSYFMKFLDENYNENDSNTNIMFDVLTDLLVTDDIYINVNLVTTLINFSNLIKTRSICWLWDIIIFCMSAKIKAEFPIYDKKSLEQRKQISQLLRSYFKEIKSMLKIINKDVMNSFFNKNLQITSNNLVNSYEMSKPNPINYDFNTSFVEKELNTMIPDRIGPLKCFFVDLIQYYYSLDVLHPIIWAQILRAMFINFLDNPPMSQIELFQFFSKHLLLNSGPFILKILQQVRPIMSVEQRKTYNLTKLTYPKMTKSQGNLILSKIIKDWELYNIFSEASASVGHVFFVQNSITLEKIVIKVVKPMSIIQSCYEYSKLNTFFKNGTLEQRFVHNILYSTGKEFQAKHEIEHIKNGHQYYKMNYNELYSDVDINASLTTITVKENVVIDTCWFALAMTIAPGVPLSKLLESNDDNKLSKDTTYRAYLHRCFDMLIYKFFSNIIINGFYHGDLHSGNVYFSFTNEPVRKAEITIIDFGAVGTIDLFNDDPDINDLIKIIIQSIFYNYHNLFDTLTDLLNRKNINSTIDKKSDNYRKFKKSLKKIGIKNIYNYHKNASVIDIYTKSCLTSKIRTGKETSININQTKNITEEDNNFHHAKCYSSNNNSLPNTNIQDKTTKQSIESLYDYVDIHERIIKNSKITDNIGNADPLQPGDCDINTSTNVISFTEVMNMIMEFYSKSNVNIPITIPDLYELLKAYILINSLTTQINYDPLRMSIMLGKILFDYNNIGKAVKNPIIVIKMLFIYNIENKKYNKILEKIKQLQNQKTT